MAAGRAHVQNGDDAAALIEFKNAVQEQPSSMEARIALADAFERTFDLASAEQHLRKALEQGGDGNVLVPRIASIMLDRGMQDALAREYSDRHLKQPQAESDLRALVAIAFVSQKRLPQADEQLRGVLVDTPVAHLAKAQRLLAAGDAAKALTEMETVPTSQASWWTLRALSRLYATVGQAEKSADAIQRAHVAAPWHWGLMGEYGEALIKAGKPQEAKAMRDKLKKNAPNYFWTHYLNAVILALEGAADASHASALRVLAVSPNHLPAVLLAASAELQGGDLLMAETRLKKILKEHPYAVPVLQMLSATQLRLRRFEEAEENIRRGLSVAPTSERLLALRADVELQRGDTKKAANTLESILARNPKDATSMLRLSEIRAREGSRAAALTLMEQAAEISQDDPLLRDRIISMAMRMGDVNRVRELANHAITTKPKDPQSHLVQAVALGFQSDTEGARRSILAALDIKPGFDAALMALAGVSKQPEQRQELMARYAKAVADPSATVRTFLSYAALLKQDSTRRKEVAGLLEKGVVAHPAAAPLREALVHEYLRSGNAEQALATAQTGAAANNAPAAAEALLAQTYQRVGKPEQAANAYRKLVASYPQRADWRLQLAGLEIAANRKVEAVGLLRGLITERPFDSAAFIELAKVTANDNEQEAFSVVRQMGEYQPNALTAMLIEGDVLAQVGKVDAALKQFRTAGRAGAEPAASLRLVALLDHAGRGSEADQEMAAALRRSANDVSVVTLAAKRALGRGESEKAVQLLLALRTSHPQNPLVLNELAWAQVQAKQVKAIDAASQAAQLQPDDPNILDTLGLAQALAGKRAEALESLRTAVNLAPQEVLPKLHLAEQLAAGGDRAEAKKLLSALDEGRLSPAERARRGELLKIAGN